MEDVDPLTFGQLVHCLYTHEIESEELSDIELLGKLWILAKRVLTPNLQNKIMHTLHGLQGKPGRTQSPEEKHFTGLLDLVFGDLQEEHPILRSILLDHLRCYSNEWLDIWAEHLPRKLSVELMKMLGHQLKSSRAGKDINPQKKLTAYYVDVLDEDGTLTGGSGQQQLIQKTQRTILTTTQKLNLTSLTTIVLHAGVIR